MPNTINLNGFTKMGMAQSFGVTPRPTKLPHWAKNQGIKLKDKIAIISFEADVDIKLDEFVEDNFVLAFFGNMVSSGEISIGNSPDIIERAVAFVGSNTYGPNLEILLPKVAFSCDKLVEFIGDAAWGELDVTGELLINSSNAYGTIAFGTSPTGAPFAVDNVDNYYFGMGQVWTGPVIA